MSNFDKRTPAERKPAAPSMTAIWGIGVALLLTVVLIFVLSKSGATSFNSKAVIGLAILLLLVRLVRRYMRSGVSRAAQPDPKSNIKLT
jgi:high-affinity Fe2+/Pb2+ permease